MQEEKFFFFKFDSLKVQIEHKFKERTTKSTKGRKKLIRHLLKKQWKLLKKKNFFTKCDFACIGEITMWKHINTKHNSVHSDVGAKQIKLRKVP